MGNFNYIGIDIFSGAGGLSLGAQNAGIDIVLAIEKEPNAARTFKTNHPETNVLIEDIREIKIDKLNLNKPFIIFGGPPCQGFSVSNRQTRNINNDNNSLFEEFVRFVKFINPTWFLFENVEGIVSFNNGETVNKICETFESLNYTVKWEVLTASNYGVPQDRNRFFLVGNNLGVDFHFPKPISEKISVIDAIGDLPDLENGAKLYSAPYKSSPSEYAKKLRNGSKLSVQNYVSENTPLVLERYKYIKPGQNWESIPERLMLNYKDKTRCHSGIYKRLLPDKPSVVISNYRKNMLIHPFQDRGLSVREAARIQSFPDDFIFEGTLMHQQQQIGNAVPPILAEEIFKEIIKMTQND
ncbi:MAG: DNA cytosine methyltransferase [Bacteroidales bacterium]|nr:DNA cytosine methyltransferase [Bacteroidales bacterium]